VPVDQWHHEGGPGQYELDLGPLDPLGLADALLFTKQVLREVARAYGYRATFMARPFADQPGSGLNLHQRLPATAVDGGGPLPEAARRVVAGQLEHARGLCALAAPTVNSYKRLHSGPEAPGAVVWAHSNRAALVRISAFQGDEASIEYRGADPSANPYLLLTGLLAAALDGLDSQLELAAPADESAGGFDAQPTESRPEPLPRDLHAALDALSADDVLVDAFDHQLLARLLDGRRAEAEEYRGLVSDWERNQYLDRA
jgi:glutamine synthetase